MICLSLFPRKISAETAFKRHVMCLFFESKFRKLKINRRILVPLRYNYDKPEKPRRIKGFEVFSLVFHPFPNRKITLK